LAQGAVEKALQAVRETFGEPEGLLSDLAADATWVRARSGELMQCVPRLTQLWANGELGGPVAAHDVLDEISAAWSQLSSTQARSIESLADTLWERALMAHPSELSADELLGELLYLPLPMVRWFEPWLGSLDGPGALQLSAAILSPIHTDAWAGQADARQQLESWAGTEPVVMGLTIVGGVHLDDGDLGDLLDRLL
jgi:hypothetical protein